jgi:hypothetical protein
MQIMRKINRKEMRVIIMTMKRKMKSKTQTMSTHGRSISMNTTKRTTLKRNGKRNLGPVLKNQMLIYRSYKDKGRWIVVDPLYFSIVFSVIDLGGLVRVQSQ